MCGVCVVLIFPTGKIYMNTYLSRCISQVVNHRLKYNITTSTLGELLASGSKPTTLKAASCSIYRERGIAPVSTRMHRSKRYIYICACVTHGVREIGAIYGSAWLHNTTLRKHRKTCQLDDSNNLIVQKFNDQHISIPFVNTF